MALNRPIAWPSYSCQVSELNVALDRIKEWKVELEEPVTNKGASLIAQSVTSQRKITIVCGS